MVEQRLIDANEFERYIDRGHFRPPYELCFSENDVVNMIRKQSTVDAVPVVRCKDCIFPKNGICHNPKTFGAIVKDDWFCADGERKDGKQNAKTD